MNYQEIINRIFEEVKQMPDKGKVASYIPALAEVPDNKLGISVCMNSGEEFSVGDADEKFSIQSISKVFTLTLAMKMHADEIWKRVGREPSGNSFDSLVQLEYESGIPRNPFINAGALVITDSIFEGVGKTKKNLLQFIRSLSGNSNIYFDEEVADSEKQTGHRNRAVASFLKSYGNFVNSPDDVLDVYFHQCSIEMSCNDLSRAFLFLANSGIQPQSNTEIVNKRQAKRINALMLTCGTYNAVGDFAYYVGLPAKSGVGGGIVAVIPKLLSITAWSPGLNEQGNSLLASKVLELFTTYTGNSVF